MCGINGFNFRDLELINSMNCETIHRGPDNQGVWANDSVSLGHLRLSIIDVSEDSNQPMHYTAGGKSYVIVFNGEIYNYIELKEKLKTFNYNFTTQSDTEVILAAYAKWGEKCVEYFNGMWSFCLYDLEAGKLFCSRDRVGEKPFFYYYHNNTFIFSSELKSILKFKGEVLNAETNICAEAVELFFTTGFIPAPYTIYNRVHKLSCSHNLVYHLKENKLETYSYYFPAKQQLVNNKNLLLDELDVLFNSSIQLRMRSDVAVGSFLSGGIDSTAIVYNLDQHSDNQLHTFSVGFDGKYDETPFIKLAQTNLKHINHHHEYYTHEYWNKHFKEFYSIYDEPFGDNSGFPAVYVSQMAKKHVTVVQSGDGGDEIFGGYRIYNKSNIIDQLRTIPVFFRKILLESFSVFKSNKLRGPVEALKMSLGDDRYFLSEFLNYERLNLDTYKNWCAEKLQTCIELTGGSLPDSIRMFDVLYNTLADHHLTKVDRASMHSALEVRTPYLDYRFIEYSLKIPAKYKYDYSDNKILLKEYVRTRIKNFPPAILTRDKQGFTPPVAEWMMDPRFNQDLLNDLEVLKRINPQIHAFYEKHIVNKESNVKTIYTLRLFNFGNWYRRWIVA